MRCAGYKGELSIDEMNPIRAAERKAEEDSMIEYYQQWGK